MSASDETFLRCAEKGTLSLLAKGRESILLVCRVQGILRAPDSPVDLLEGLPSGTPPSPAAVGLMHAVASVVLLPDRYDLSWRNAWHGLLPLFPK